MPGLEDYRRRRDFTQTSEPAGAELEVGSPRTAGTEGCLPGSVETGVFVVQEHDATRLHYDFRIEVDGVLRSWAVPKGPSYDPSVKRLAVPTEDHPMEYQHYEGVIGQGSYGAGPSLLWDRGTYVNISHDSAGRIVPLRRALEEGHASLWLRGRKLEGGWSLTRTRPSGRAGRERDQWLMVKRVDAAADPTRDITAERPESVKSGLTIGQLRAGT